jgi:hypothetical protein
MDKNTGETRARQAYWEKIADQEFKTMDEEAQAQWSELR